jgi:hypothetical protein
LNYLSALPVPWIQWSNFRVNGVVRELESGESIGGLVICVFDKDQVKDDSLAVCETDEQGRSRISFTDAREPLHKTKFAIRTDANPEEYLDIEIPRHVVDG